MVTNEEVANRYTRHGLQVIRFSNGLQKGTATAMDRYGRELRAILAGYHSGMNKRQLDRLLARVQRLTEATYRQLYKDQKETIQEFLELEADFATKAAALLRKASEAAVKQAFSNLTVHGASLADNWKRQAANAYWNVSTSIRNAQSASQPVDVLLSNVLGSRESAGTINVLKKNASSLVESSVQSARQTAHHTSFIASRKDINGLQWFSILDSKVCPNCALRSGRLYDLSYAPIGHSVPMNGTPPLHPFCRCLLMPMRFPDGPPKDGGKGHEKFVSWLEKQTREQQEEIFGVGRTQLWRDGKLSLTELIGQDGLVMKLEDLRRLVGT